MRHKTLSFIIFLQTIPTSIGYITPIVRSKSIHHDGIISSAQKYRNIATTLQASPTSSSSEKEITLGAISSTIPELTKSLGGKGRAQLVWDCYKIGIDPALFFSSTNSPPPLPTTPLLSKFISSFETHQDILNLLPTSRQTQTLGKTALDALANTYNGTVLEGGVASLSHLSTSEDGTVKMLITLEQDGLEVESVIIPWFERGWSTLCVSSQVGCRQGCTFCATGKMGLKRSLTTNEILAQVFYAKKITRLFSSSSSNQKLPPDISNIVFMGMGEPTDNLSAVTRAISILTDETLFSFARQQITLSTVAPSPQSFLRLKEVPAVLAWSIHAANDVKRRQLVPTATYSVQELKEALIEVLKGRCKNLQNVMLEVALLNHVNDSPEDALEMANVAQDIIKAVDNPTMKLMVNLIPYNDTGGGIKYTKPSKERVLQYQEVLWKRGIYAHVRETRGDDESAACGQLATRKRKEREVLL
uniref:Radical SAM core domain-containing protein n=1 Tax=Ditylum brightwellii TaxID=49249 RepID=A0A7S4RUD1_9STRA